MHGSQERNSSMLIIIHAEGTISRFLTTDATTSSQITSHLTIVVEMVEPMTTVRHLEIHPVALSEHTKGTIQPFVPLTQVDVILMSASTLKSVEADATIKDMALITTHKLVARANTMANGISSIEETSDAASIPTSNASVNLIVLPATQDMTRGNLVKSATLKTHADHQIVDARSLQDAHSMMNNSRATTSNLASISAPIHLVANSPSPLLTRASMTNRTFAKHNT
jgi:hypothetical protein